MENSIPVPPITDASRPLHPVPRTALRLFLSKDEYTSLQQILRTRAPRTLRQLVTTRTYSSLTQGSQSTHKSGVREHHTLTTLRATLRLSLALQSGLSLYDVLKGGITRARVGSGTAKPPIPITKGRSRDNIRVSLSVAAILLLYRLLFRFLTQLRANLLHDSAAPFRHRNPRVAKALTARLAPAIGASLAGAALGACPREQLRITLAIYALTRAGEFLYNAAERRAGFKEKLPWWWGSWLMMPLATGQLLHAFVFERDCFPQAYGNFILASTPNYIQRRPVPYPSSLPWPGPHALVDSLAEMSRQSWPAFTSPILFPHTTLPLALQAIEPVIAPAHPAIASLSCATLHPTDPSCIRTVSLFTLGALPKLFKFFTLFYAVFALPKFRRLLLSGKTDRADREESTEKQSGVWGEMYKVLARALRTALFLTGAIGTAWSSICLFQHLLPRRVLAQERWFLGGFGAGLWAFVDRKAGRSQVLYSVRMSLDSATRIARKKGWRVSGNGLDVFVFIAGLASMQAVFDSQPDAVSDRTVRWILGYLRGHERTSLKLE